MVHTIWFELTQTTLWRPSTFMTPRTFNFRSISSLKSFNSSSWFRLTSSAVAFAWLIIWSLRFVNSSITWSFAIDSTAAGAAPGVSVIKLEEVWYSLEGAELKMWFYKLLVWFFVVGISYAAYAKFRNCCWFLETKSKTNDLCQYLQYISLGFVYRSCYKVCTTKKDLHIFGGDFILIFCQLFHSMANMTSG